MIEGTNAMTEQISIDRCKNKRNEALDILRTVSMIAVVFLHNVFPGMFGEAFWSLLGFAVPVFFMISGYFMFGTDASLLLKRAKKTAILTLWASLVYILYTLITGGIQKIISDISLSALAKWLILNVPALSIPLHLWYLYALIYCYLIFAAVVKLGWLDKLSPCFISLIAVSFCVSTVLPAMGVIQYHDTLYRNAFLSGLPFMSIGYEIRKREANIKIKTSFLWGIAIFSGIVTLINQFTPISIGSYTMVIAIAIFLIAIRSRREVKCHMISIIGQKYSRDVYIYHVMVAYILRNILSAMNIYGFMIVKWLFPIAVLLFSLGIAMAIFYVKRQVYKRMMQSKGAN